MRNGIPYIFLYQNITITGVIDCTECYINRPSENNQSYYGYKKRHTLKYTRAGLCPMGIFPWVYPMGLPFGISG